MRGVRRALAAVAVCLAVGCGGSSGSSNLPGAVTEVRPSDGPLQATLADAHRKAASRGLVAYAQVYADWCAPCRALRSVLDDPQMIEARRGVYLVRVEYDAWKDPVRALAGGDVSVPYLFEILPDGSAGRWLDGRAWGEDTAANIAPVLDGLFHQGQGNAPRPALAAPMAGSPPSGEVADPAGAPQAPQVTGAPVTLTPVAPGTPLPARP
jgi:thiol-disulfide isomerase/thioredoxin